LQTSFALAQTNSTCNNTFYMPSGKIYFPQLSTWMDTATHAYMFTHPLCREQQNDIHVLFKYKKTHKDGGKNFWTV